jgi:hypothetical protein
MSTFIRQVREIEPFERQTLEHMLGQPLIEGQQIIINLIDGNVATPDNLTPAQLAASKLPDWCDVYRGLSDNEIADIESSIVRSSSSRSWE